MVSQVTNLQGYKPQFLGVLAIAGALSILGFFISRDAFWVAYLHAYSLWLGLGLGCLGLGLLHNLVGGRWGEPFRNVFVAGSKTMPILGLLFIPIFLGGKTLYLWMRPEAAHDPILLTKASYLNPSFFAARAVFYFVLWFLISRVIPKRNAGTSGFGMLLLITTVSFAAFDWLMSTEPHWFSSIYGAIYVACGLISTLSFLILLSYKSANEDLLHDLGKLLLMAVMLWAYFSFSQYLIIWSGKLPEELSWYQHRRHGGWKEMGFLMILAHFFIPFFLLLSRKLKRSGHLLVKVAFYLILMRFVEAWWQIGPVFNSKSFHVHWLNFTLPLALGALWLLAFCFFYPSGEKITIKPIVRTPNSRKDHGPKDQH